MRNKITQKIILSADNSVSTGLWAHLDQRYEFLAGPFELSFHPFTLEAWAERGVVKKPQAQEQNPVITWNIRIIDDEEEEPLFKKNLSAHRCLLLLSESLVGLEEIAHALGLSIVSIIPRPLDNELSIELIINNNSCALEAFLIILKAAFDALLFVRGLKLDASVVSLSPLNCEKQKQLARLNTIMSARL